MRRAPGRRGDRPPTPAEKARARRIVAALRRAMPAADVELAHRSPLELLVATILSAQCTDQRVNQVTPELFRRYRNAEDYARGNRAELEALIRPTGFFKSKARNLIATGLVLSERFGGRVPDTLAALVSLPGVGRKTANVMLANCFGQPAVIVDTHVRRVAQRLDLAHTGDPDRIEARLQGLLPRRDWTGGSQRLLLHGRYVCTARKPLCHRCPIEPLCEWEGKQVRR